MVLGRQALGLRRKSWKILDFGVTSTRSEGEISSYWKSINSGGQNFLKIILEFFQLKSWDVKIKNFLNNFKPCHGAPWSYATHFFCMTVELHHGAPPRSSTVMQKQKCVEQLHGAPWSSVAEFTENPDGDMSNFCATQCSLDDRCFVGKIRFTK